MGSGRPKNPISRSRQMRIALTDEDCDYVEILAKQWNLPMATVIYGLFAQTLSICVRRKPQSPATLVLAAAEYLAEHGKQHPPGRYQAGTPLNGGILPHEESLGDA